MTRGLFAFGALKPTSSRLCLTEPNSVDALLDSSTDFVVGEEVAGPVVAAVAEADAAATD